MRHLAPTSEETLHRHD